MRTASFRSFAYYVVCLLQKINNMLIGKAFSVYILFLRLYVCVFIYDRVKLGILIRKKLCSIVLFVRGIANPAGFVQRVNSGYLKYLDHCMYLLQSGFSSFIGSLTVPL